MKAKLIKTDGDYLEAIVEIAGHEYIVMGEFNGKSINLGSELDIELSGNDLNDLDWDEIFTLNPSQEKRLQHIKGWTYFGLGEIVSVNPVIVDCGIIKIEDAFSTKDVKCLGEFIGLKINRLDAYAT